MIFISHRGNTIIPTATSIFLAPAFGLLTNTRRFSELPKEEAKYMDAKVREFYK